MKKFKILDCTLRDGGYYTNWDFSKPLVEKYMSAMQKLPIDILEIGYRSTPQKEYMGKYFYYPAFVLDQIAEMNSNKQLALMFNEKTTKPDHLDKMLNGLKGKVSIIRLAVNPEYFDRAFILGEALKVRGFDFTFNLMYMSKYFRDQDLLKKTKHLNGFVKYLTIVDSYGGMLPAHVKEVFHKIREYYDGAIAFHGHNNMELAFANSLAAIEAGCDFIDGTIMGMGRGAGNLKTELLLTYLASEGIIEFDFNVLSELIEEWIPIYEKYRWGTNLPYMVSGCNSLEQKDVMEWITQRYYSFNSIVRALHNKKTGDKDNVKLPEFSPSEKFENVFIIGGGPTAVEHADAIKLLIKDLDKVCIVHASSKNARSYSDINCKQYYCLVGNEGHRLEKVFNNLHNFNGECILPPYPRKMGTYIPLILKNNSFELKEVNFTEQYEDAHTALALQTSIYLNAKQVFLVGYDGYIKDTITQREQSLTRENEHLFSMAKKVINLLSLTPTEYNLKINSAYSLL